MKGSLWVAQFMARQKPFLVDLFVPNTVSGARYASLDFAALGSSFMAALWISNWHLDCSQSQIGNWIPAALSYFWSETDSILSQYFWVTYQRSRLIFTDDAVRKLPMIDRKRMRWAPPAVSF